MSNPSYSPWFAQSSVDGRARKGSRHGLRICALQHERDARAHIRLGRLQINGVGFLSYANFACADFFAKWTHRMFAAHLLFSGRFRERCELYAGTGDEFTLSNRIWWRLRTAPEWPGYSMRKACATSGWRTRPISRPGRSRITTVMTVCRLRACASRRMGAPWCTCAAARPTRAAELPIPRTALVPQAAGVGGRRGRRCSPLAG